MCWIDEFNQVCVETCNMESDKLSKWKSHFIFAYLLILSSTKCSHEKLHWCCNGYRPTKYWKCNFFYLYNSQCIYLQIKCLLNEGFMHKCVMHIHKIVTVLWTFHSIMERGVNNCWKFNDLIFFTPSQRTKTFFPPHLLSNMSTSHQKHWLKMLMVFIHNLHHIH